MILTLGCIPSTEGTCNLDHFVVLSVILITNTVVKQKLIMNKQCDTQWRTVTQKQEGVKLQETTTGLESN
jgi:hypothetical protein